MTSRITFEVTGEPAGLKGAVDQSVASLGKLNDFAKRSAKESAAAGDQTTESNRRVARSFTGVAEDAGVAADRVKRAYAATVKAADTAEIAAERVAAAQEAVATATTESARKAAGAVLAKAERQKAAADIEVQATERVAQAHVDSARIVIRSLDEETAAIEVHADKARAAAATIAEAAAKGADATSAAADKTAASSRRAADASEAGAARTKKAFGSSEAALSRGGKTIGAILIATGAAAVYSAAKYQAATTQYITQAGAGVAETKKLARGMLDMAGQVGDTPNHLAEGMYHVVSSLNNLIPPAHRTSVELGILREAAKGAAIGGANLNDTTYALSSAMNALGQTAVPQARKTMAELNAIVGSGDMHMKDLMDAMSTGLLPSAKSFGLSLRSVGSALAYMTDTGVPAQQAATRLRMSLSLLGSPTAKSAALLHVIGDSSKDATARTSAMAKALDAAGLHTSQLADDLRKPDGILVALEDLKRHFHTAGVSATAQGAFISAAFGGGKSGSALESLFNNLDKLRSKYRQVGDSASKYGGDWTKTQQTLTFQLHQVEGEVEAVGVKLGTVLIPKVEEGFKDLREFAHWLDQNRAAAGAMAAVITGLATVAIGSYLIGNLRKAGLLLKGLGEFTGFGGGSGVSRGVAGAESALGGRGALIGGSRSGMGLPGSPTNPEVVAIEDGQYAGLGGEAAPIGKTATAAERDAAKVESVAPSAASQVERAAPAVDGAAFASTIASGLKTALGGVMRGGVIAAGGVAASAVTKQVIGGKTGEETYVIGRDASIGAGLGSLLGPEGTIAGGVLGGLVGAFGEFVHTKADNYGNQIADKFTAGLKADLAHLTPKSLTDLTNLHTTVASTVTASQNQHAAATTVVAPQLGPRAPVPSPSKGLPSALTPQLGPHASQPQLSPSALAAYTAAQVKSGQKIGAEYAQVLADQSTYFAGGSKAIDHYISQVEAKLGKLPDASRKGAVGAIVQATEEFQKDGRLPEDATNDLITALESQWSDLGPSIVASLQTAMSGAQTTMQQAAANTTPVLNKMAAAKDALSQSKIFIDSLHTNWSSIPRVAQLTTGNAVQVFSQTMGTLKTIISSSTGTQRATAEKDYKLLHDNAISYFTDMKGGVKAQITDLSSQMGPLSAQGTAAVAGEYSTMVSVIEGEMASGAVATNKGIKNINKQLNAALKQMGYSSFQQYISKTATTTTEATTPRTAFGPRPGSPPSIANPGGSPKLSAAQGALVQIGRQGDHGRDTIPMNVGGVPIIVGSGEQAAVFTHSQQQVANRYLAPVGGLTGLFNNVRTPHYMAGGGFVEAAGTNYTVGEEPMLAQRLNALAHALGITLTGISGYRSPAHSVEVGGFADDPHTRGDASDTQGAQTIPEAVLERFGLTRPFGGAAEADHIQLLGSALGNVLQASVASIATPPSIKAPQTGLPGDIGALTNIGLGGVAGAANQVLSQAFAASMAPVGTLGGGYAGVGGGGSVGAAWNGQWVQVMQQIAAKYHWNLDDWRKVINKESRGDPTARNPNGGAFGLGQFKGTTAAEYAKYGALSTNPVMQIEADAQYILDRYQNPTNAWAHEESAGWYSEGGLLHEFATGGPVASASKTKGIPKTKPGKRKQSHPKGRAVSRSLSVNNGIQNLRLVPGFGVESSGLISLMGTIGDNQSQGLTGMDSILLQLPTTVSDGTGIAAGRYQLNAQDASDLQPYLQNLRDLGVPLAGGLAGGMTYQQGYALYKQSLRAMNADITANGSTDSNTAWGENLADIQQVLDYVGSDPGHRIITAADMAVLRSATPPAGFDWKDAGAPGSALDQVEFNLDDWMLSTYKAVQISATAMNKDIEKASPEYRERAANVLSLEHTEMKRYKGIYAQITKLGIQNKKNALDEARKAYSTDESKQDLRASIAALESEIRAEDKVPLGDQAYLTSLADLKSNYQQQLSVSEATTPTAVGKSTPAKFGYGTYTPASYTPPPKNAQQTNLKVQIATLSNQITQERNASKPNQGKINADTAALQGLQAKLRTLGDPNRSSILAKQIALQVAELRAQLTPIESSLYMLGGSKTTAGAPSSGKSVYGSLQTDLSRLGAARNSNTGYIVTAQGAIPALTVDKAQMRSNLGSLFDTSTFSPANNTTSATSTDTSLLAGLLAQQNALIAQGNQIDTAITSAVSSMGPLVPKYEHGGQVANTGLALVHEGETIIPNPAGPYGNSAGGGGDHHINLHFHGPGTGEFLRDVRATVDGRMVHPSNVRAVSAAVGTRGRALAGAPGGFRR